MAHILAILGLALAFPAFVLLQRWMLKHHPEIKGLDNKAVGCDCSHAEQCSGANECGELPSGELPIARIRRR